MVVSYSSGFTGFIDTTHKFHIIDDGRYNPGSQGLYNRHRDQ